jgi:hypothetical protein
VLVTETFLLPELLGPYCECVLLAIIGPVAPVSNEDASSCHPSCPRAAGTAGQHLGIRTRVFLLTSPSSIPLPAAKDLCSGVDTAQA